MDLTAKNIFKGIYKGLNLITYFLNYDQTKEVRTKILGLKVFAHIQHVTLIPGRFAFYEVILGYFDRAKPILKLLLVS